MNLSRGSHASSSLATRRATMSSSRRLSSPTASMAPFVGLARAAHVASAAPSMAAATGDWMATASAQAAGRVSSARRASTSSSSSPSSFSPASAAFVARRRTVTMMPVGVPRVPYRLPKGGAWVWIDIWNCLYRDRIIFLQKPVDDELANQLVATMLYLDSESQKDIRIYINCTGGEVVPSLALHDTMRYLKSDVGTIGFGACMGMSGFLLATGTKGKRAVLPNTRVMLHHPSGVARGQAADIDNEARELLRVRNYVNAVLCNATGKPMAEVQRDFNRNKYFSAEEALEYGVIDRILPPPRTVQEELAEAQKAAASGKGRPVAGPKKGVGY